MATKKAPVDRLQKGFDLYNTGSVTLDWHEGREYMFTVKSSTIKKINCEEDGCSMMVESEPLIVSFDGCAWLCHCEDYQYRQPKALGAFTCKHINACIFKMGEILTKTNPTAKIRASGLGSRFNELYQGSWD